MKKTVKNLPMNLIPFKQGISGLITEMIDHIFPNPFCGISLYLNESKLVILA
ncbi:hypothetical protein [Gimesia aquarii]|uniref:Uncharacterized protein n=1 Tax=Gimesia aquarii TaxID=2527964 RepID=A0A517W0P5_9PLAN|nr:hypothetical protein [Gimesia aquarii]QDT98816.1 hypothetical protein V144x_43240 [Gimesia aquarii]